MIFGMSGMSITVFIKNRLSSQIWLKKMTCETLVGGWLRAETLSSQAANKKSLFTWNRLYSLLTQKLIIFLITCFLQLLQKEVLQ